MRYLTNNKIGAALLRLRTIQKRLGAVTSSKYEVFTTDGSLYLQARTKEEAIDLADENVRATCVTAVWAPDRGCIYQATQEDGALKVLYPQKKRKNF